MPRAVCSPIFWNAKSLSKEIGPEVNHSGLLRQRLNKHDRHELQRRSAQIHESVARGALFIYGTVFPSLYILVLNLMAIPEDFMEIPDKYQN